MRLQIVSPPENTRGPLWTESLLGAVHAAGDRRQPLKLQIFGRQGDVGLSADVPGALRTLFLQELQDAYPGVQVRADRSVSVPLLKFRRQLRLRPDVLSIRTHREFLDLADDRAFSDPLTALLSAVRTRRSADTECLIEISLRPASRHRVWQARRIAKHAAAEYSLESRVRLYLFAVTSPHLLLRAVGRLLALPRIRRGRESHPDGGKTEQQLFECLLTITVLTSPAALSSAQSKLQQITSAFGRFTQGDAAFHSCQHSGRRRGFLMTPAEIATLWHPLTTSADGVSRVVRSDFREIEPPYGVSAGSGDGDVTILGRVQYRRERRRFGITTDDLRRHLIAVGKTGCGKSTFLRSVVTQQMEAGRGVILMDPHGQLADDVLDTVPRHRINDVVYFDAAERKVPVRFNPMMGPPGTDPTLVADGILTSFQNVFGLDAGSAPRLLHIFRNCLLSLVGTPHATLSSVQRLLIDAVFRKTVVSNVRNPAVRDFWLTEFNRWNDRDRTQYIASLQNKLGAFLTNQRLNTILSAGEKGINLRQIMDRSQILICNLSKGTVGHDSATLLGSLLLSSLQISAMSRADVPESDRPDCVVVIDEFHSYLSEGNSTMADALAESRKYRTSYVLSTQMLEQLDSQTLSAVLGNCGSLLSMTVGPRDAEILSGLLGRGLTPEDLMKVPKYHGYLQLLVAGTPQTFSMTTLPPAKTFAQRASTVRRVSQQRYGQQTDLRT